MNGHVADVPRHVSDHTAGVVGANAPECGGLDATLEGHARLGALVLQLVGGKDLQWGRMGCTWGKAPWVRMASGAWGGSGRRFPCSVGRVRSAGHRVRNPDSESRL